MSKEPKDIKETPLVDDEVSRFTALVKKTNVDKPGPEDVDELRRMLDESPTLWRLFGDLAQLTIVKLILRLGKTPAVQESARRGIAELRSELGYDAGSALERLVIDRVAICWLELHRLESNYISSLEPGQSMSYALHLERRLMFAQKRYLHAIEALARVRRLLRSDFVQVSFNSKSGAKGSSRAPGTCTVDDPAVEKTTPRLLPDLSTHGEIPDTPNASSIPGEQIEDRSIR